MKLETEISRLQAERDVARHEQARLRRLIEEIRMILADNPNHADQKIKALIDRIRVSDEM
jgi:hypothetical protein